MKLVSYELAGKRHTGVLSGDWVWRISSLCPGAPDTMNGAVQRFIQNSCKQQNSNNKIANVSP